MLSITPFGALAPMTKTATSITTATRTTSTTPPTSCPPGYALSRDHRTGQMSCVKLATPEIQSTPVPTTLTPRSVTTAVSPPAGVTQATRAPQPVRAAVTAAGAPAPGCPRGTVAHRPKELSSPKCVAPSVARRACPFPTVPLLKKQSGSSVFYVCADRTTIPLKIAAFFPSESRWRVAMLKATPTGRPELGGLRGDYQETESSPTKPSDAVEVTPEDYAETVEAEVVTMEPLDLRPKRPAWLAPALIVGSVLAVGTIAVVIARR